MLHFPLMLKANSSITARYLLSSIDSLALTIANDAKLLLVNTTDVDTTGKAASWNYLYSSISNMKEYYFHTENTVVIYDSSRDMRVGIAPIDLNWIDSDSALYLAELKGGYDFRTIYPEHQINAVLYKPVCPPFYNYWDIQYIGTDSSITIRINALTGQVITSVDQNANREKLPTSFVLFQNYPNPFNSQTNIYFELKKQTKITITIFNVRGQMVTEIFKGISEPGYHAINWNASNVSAGMYLIKMEAGIFIGLKKCMLLK